MCENRVKLTGRFPYVLAFLDGAFSINSGGRAEEKDLAKHTDEELELAEAQLREVYDLFKVGPRVLGMMADTGFSLWGQVAKDTDEQVKLKVYELLDRHY